MNNEYKDKLTQFAQAAHSVAAYTPAGANRVFELMTELADEDDQDDSDE